MNFDEHGQLVPKGKLVIHTAEVDFHKATGFLFPRMIWKDEDGLLWNISHVTEVRRLTPVEWPTEGHAVYVLRYKVWREHLQSIEANSFEEAKVKLIETVIPHSKPEYIELAGVSAVGAP